MKTDLKKIQITSLTLDKLLKGLVVITWVILVVACYAFTVLYGGSPGKQARAPSTWPESKSVKLESKKLTLVTFIHPQCFCSKASINELLKIVSHCPGRIKPYILVLLPTGMDSAFAHTELWQMAKSVPEATVIMDIGGRESKLFNSETSGQTVLYDPSGKLLFRGGITGSRGHEGDNLGQTSIEQLALSKSSTVDTNPVFGCPLVERP